MVRQQRAFDGATQNLVLRGLPFFLEQDWLRRPQPRSQICHGWQGQESAREFLLGTFRGRKVGANPGVPRVQGSFDIRLGSTPVRGITVCIAVYVAIYIYSQSYT